MARLKSRTQCPINGFQFTQPETGAQFKTWDFNEIVRQVIAHRQQNPRFNLGTDVTGVGNEVDQQNALRMLSIRGGENYAVANDGGAGPNFFNPQPGLAPKLAAAAGAVKKLRAGMSLIEAWEAAGYPAVGLERATARAAVCTQCPRNQLGNWTRWFTVPASEHIRKRAEKLNEMKLNTPHDAILGTCEVCLCVMSAKVHVTTELLREHTTPALLAELPAHCWVVKELNA